MNRLSTPGERSTCDYCEAHVTVEFRRIYGTENGRAKRCSECDSWPRIEKGSARGDDVNHPDPQNHAERRGGQDLRGVLFIDGGRS